MKFSNYFEELLDLRMRLGTTTHSANRPMNAAAASAISIILLPPKLFVCWLLITFYSYHHTQRMFPKFFLDVTYLLNL